jgi:hypothetical protein
MEEKENGLTAAAAGWLRQARVQFRCCICRNSDSDKRCMNRFSVALDYIAVDGELFREAHFYR